MTLLQRYMFRNAAYATFVTGLALTAMIWLTQAVRQLDLVTGKGQAIWLFLWATILALPKLIIIIMPIALFLGMLHTLNRLNADSELVVMNAASMSPAKVARPFVFLALIVFLLGAFLTLYVLPNSLRELRDVVALVRTDVITRLLEPGRFIELDKGVTFHYREKGAGESLEGVLVQDRRNEEVVSTYIAARGVMQKTEDADYLVLENGSLQRQSAKASENAIVTFNQYVFDLSALVAKSSEGSYQPSERTTGDLLRADFNDPAIAPFAQRVRSELHDRLTAPLFAFAAAAIAFAAVGTPQTTRQGRGFRIVGAVFFLIAARACAFGAYTLSVGSPWGIVAMYAVPALTMAAAIGYFFFSARVRRPAPAFQQVPA
jgi:lipopolysaccharide export system permease protein